MNYEKIKKLYESSGKKQDFFEKIDIKQSTFYDILAKRNQIRVENLEKIAKYFDKPVGYFFDEPDINELNLKHSEIISESLILTEKLNAIHEIIAEKNRTISALESHIATLMGKKETVAS